MRLHSLLAIAALLSISLFARADDVTTVFDLNSTFVGYPGGQPGSGTISGTLTLDDTLGYFTGANLTVSGLPSEDGTLDTIKTGGGPYFGSVGLSVTGDTAYILDLYLMVSTLTGYTGSGICSLSSSPACYINDLSSYVAPPGYIPPPGTSEAVYVASSGTLEPETVAPTPEPSSVLLLATGLLGIAVLSGYRSWRGSGTVSQKLIS